MSGGNVTINQLPTQAAMATGDSIPAWSATGAATYQAFPNQVVLAGVAGLPTATSATAGAATLPSGPAGFIVVTLGTTPVHLPYYAV